MNDFWLREIKVNTAGLEFVYPEFEIQFRVEFDDEAEPDIGIVELYNLKRETENKIKKGRELILAAGYHGDIGTVIAGKISDVYAFPEGVDRVCEVEVLDATDDFLTRRISKTYKAGTKASQVLADILAMTGLEIGRVSLPKDTVYKNGKTVSGKIKDAAKKIVAEAGGRLYIKHGAVFAVPRNYTGEVAVLLTKDSGLIRSPTRIDSDDGRIWEMESLLNYRIRAGTKVQVKSKTANGTFRVVKGEHRSGGDEHITRIEVAAL